MAGGAHVVKIIPSARLIYKRFAEIIISVPYTPIQTEGIIARAFAHLIFTDDQPIGFKYGGEQCKVFAVRGTDRQDISRMFQLSSKHE